MKQNKNILVCPLDWGLGHATRMVPVIEMLTKNNANVIIAADNSPLDFLTQRFPNITSIKFEGYSPVYPKNGSMSLAMLQSLPGMLKKAKEANNKLHEIIKKYKIDAVISDNRYELSTTKIPSVFITHQLSIQTKGLQKTFKPIINYTINKYISKFDEIWVPDIVGGFQLSGKLSLSKKFTSKRFNIGLLSRFSPPDNNAINKTNDLLIILSGPEPQRTLLEKLLLAQVLKSKLNTIILLGKPGENIDKKINNIRLISHLTDEKFAKVVQSSNIVISRPGYSTLMDLAILGKKNTVFIPTPGQTEQEYLSKRLINKGIAFSQNQNDFNLTTAINNYSRFKGLFINNNPKLLEDRITNLLNMC